MPCHRPDFDRLGEGADLQRHVLANRAAALEQDARRDRLLESRQVDRHRIAARAPAAGSCRRRRCWSRARSRRPWPRSDGDGRARDRGALVVGDDAADGGAVGALGQKRAAEAEEGQNQGGNCRMAPRHVNLQRQTERGKPTGRERRAWRRSDASANPLGCQGESGCECQRRIPADDVLGGARHALILRFN